jgi:anti-anti-sigma factor
MPDGRVTHAEADGVHVLRYFGRVDYVMAPAIKRFADELVSHGHVRRWIFDLTQAEILDSTNLGLMARLAHTAGDRAIGDPRSIIVSTSDDINSVLRSMSFDQIFEIVSPPPGGAGADRLREEPIAGHTPSAVELGQTMLDAHRALMFLSEAGRLQFQDVVAALEADLPPSS